MGLNYMLKDQGCRKSPKVLYNQVLISVNEMSD